MVQACMHSRFKIGKGESINKSIGRPTMLPVSGAEQLQASLANGYRPMISASCAYSRFVRPAPTPYDFGIHKFHSPSSLALALTSSMALGISAKRFPLCFFALASSCSSIRTMAGATCSTQNLPSLSLSWSSLGLEKLKASDMVYCRRGFVCVCWWCALFSLQSEIVIPPFQGRFLLQQPGQ